MTKNIPLILAATCLATLHPGAAQSAPESIDLSKFPAKEVDNIVVPVPSEIFSVLDKLGTPNWRAELRSSTGKNTGNRAQVALLLGTVIAEGFIAVEAEDSEKVKDIGREVLVLAEAINVRKAVIARRRASPRRPGPRTGGRSEKNLTARSRMSGRPWRSSATMSSPSS